MNENENVGTRDGNQFREKQQFFCVHTHLVDKQWYVRVCVYQRSKCDWV